MDSRVARARDAGAGGRAGAASPAPAASDAVRAVAPADHPRGVGTADIDDLAVQAADDALISILRTLADYRGTSRFTTWASKFAVHEAGVKGRRSASQASERLGDPQADAEIEGTP